MKKGFSPGFFRCNIILPSLVVLQMRLGSFEKPQFDTKIAQKRLSSGGIFVRKSFPRSSRTLPSTLSWARTS
jgi:hypothetical protein